MTTDQFWDLIDKAIKRGPDNLDARNHALEYLLGTLPPGGWREFGKVYHQLDIAAYTWALWGAAYQINGGCSDDGFDYFRAWLISEGRNVYENALANPDSLADHVGPGDDDWEHENEDFLGLARERIQDGDLDPFPSDPAGEDWDFDDEAEMQKRYPRLCGIDPPEAPEPTHTPPPPPDLPETKGPTPPPLPPPLPRS